MIRRLLGGALAAAWMFAAGAAAAAEQSSFVMPSAGPMSMATLVTTYLNPGFRALASCSWGSSAPANGPSATPISYQCWADTTANPVLFKYYDGASWVTFGALDSSAHSWTPYRQGAAVALVATSSSAADLTTGILPAARLPNPSATTLGGTQSKTCAASSWLNAISTSGVPGCAEPALTDLTGFGTGVATFLATPSSANLAAALTDETGTGAAVFANSPVLVTPNLGTPSAATLTNATALPVSTGISGFGTGVAAFLATPSSANLRAALTDEVGTGAAYFVGGALGTPASGTLTNATGLPVSTGISGLGTGIASWLATPSSANLAGALTDETGTGAAVFATSPALVTPNLGTPSAATLTNATGLPVSTGISGLGAGVATALATPSSANLAAALTDETGTGAAVFATSPALVTPNLGTPSAATLTNATGLPVSTGISGLGTGVATVLATPSSANLAAALTDETGTGAAVFGTSPTLSAPTISGLSNFSGARRDSTQSAPAQITADQNDYNPSSVVCAISSTLLINSDAARNVTGIAGGVTGCDLFLFNNGSFPITLKDGSASSTAANRLDLGADFVLASKSAAHLKYDGGSSRWRNTTGSGTGGGSGTVTSVTAGTGLSGGTITTSGTISLAAGAIETAWSTFTPSPSCGSATIVTNSGRSKTMGKTTFVSLDFQINAIGTCVNTVGITLPNTANAGAALVGAEIAVNGRALACRVTSATSASTCVKADAASFVVNERFVISGVYENQ